MINTQWMEMNLLVHGIISKISPFLILSEYQRFWLEKFIISFDDLSFLQSLITNLFSLPLFPCYIGLLLQTCWSTHVRSLKTGFLYIVAIYNNDVPVPLPNEVSFTLETFKSLSWSCYVCLKVRSIHLFMFFCEVLDLCNWQAPTQC